MKKRTETPPVLSRAQEPWLLAVAAATIVPHFAYLPEWLALLACLALAWRGWLWHAQAPLPSRPLLLGVVLCSVAAIALQFRPLLGRDCGVALLVLFMAMKPLEMRNRRDAIVVVMLGFFLLLTHYFYSQSIATGLWLVIATTLLVATLIRLHSTERAPAIVAQAGTLLAQALPFMVIFFLLFPRVQGPLWGLPQDAHAGLSGLSDRLAPGSLSELIESGAIAFRVQFTGDLPEQSALYWRGPVFTDYDGKTWRARPPGLQPRGRPLIESSGNTYDYVVTLEAHNLRWLLALDLPVTLAAEATLSPMLETIAREPVRSRTRYRLVSRVDYVANRVESAAMLQQSLRLPEAINPRARQLAATWRERFKSPEAISNAALNHFREENFSYTLEPPLLGEMGVDDFLFSTRSGFCEHYASAYVFLMRAAGVPARVVAGYQGGRMNPIDGYFTVRQSDAHAWAEIWVEGKGWLRVDPTAAVAPSRIEQGIERALPSLDRLPALLRIDANWLRDLRDRWEAVNNAWNQWILGYTPQRQREVLTRIGFKEPDALTMTLALSALSAAALACVALAMFRQGRGADGAGRAWQACCRALARRGMPRQAWEGPLAFGARVARERPEYAALASEAAGCYAALRYGPASINDAEELNRLKACARELARSRLRRNTK
jgi:transglutaminase-like putative cysteine protease